MSLNEPDNDYNHTDHGLVYKPHHLNTVNHYHQKNIDIELNDKEKDNYNSNNNHNNYITHNKEQDAHELINEENNSQCLTSPNNYNTTNNNKISLDYQKNVSSFLKNINDYDIKENENSNEGRVFKFNRKPYINYDPLIDEVTLTEMPLIENTKWGVYQEK